MSDEQTPQAPNPELAALRAEVAALTAKLNANPTDVVQRHCNACGADVPEGACLSHPEERVNEIVIDPTTKRPTIANRKT